MASRVVAAVLLSIQVCEITAQPPIPGCMSVNNESVLAGKICYDNVLWAMNVGFKSNPGMYANYTTLSANSSFEDFQCVLADQVGSDQAGSGHNCSVPCSGTTMDICQKGGRVAIESGKAAVLAAAESEKAFSDNSSGTMDAPDEGSGFPWWAWLLTILGVVALLGAAAAAYYFLVFKKQETGKRAPKKKKRAAAPAAPAAAAPSPAEAPAPATLMSMPMAMPAAMPSMAMPAMAMPAMAMPAMAMPSLMTPVATQSVPLTYATPMASSMVTPIQTVTQAAPQFVQSYALPYES